MPESIIKPPTREILAICACGDLLIERYLACLKTIPIQLGRFEAETEVYTILKLLLRHLESVCQLARHDLVLLPSAAVIARAAFEAEVRARWMLKPIDPFEREIRWVLHLRSATKHFGKLESNKYAQKQAAEVLGKQKSSYDNFDIAISRLLTERGYKIPTKSPNVWEMLEDLNSAELYQFYIQLSAFTHTNFVAGNLYRKNLGSGKQTGEFIAAKDWWLPLAVTWKSFFNVSREFLYWIEADLNFFNAEKQVEEFDREMTRLLAKK
jgi:hypothetical protein